MKKEDYINFQENNYEAEKLITCDDYEMKTDEPWKCFDCFYKKECIYKRDKDFNNIFKINSWFNF